MTELLFVTNTPRQCGVYEWGKQTVATLAQSTRLHVTALELLENTSEPDFVDKIRSAKPDVIIYNWHPHTMAWLTGDMLSRIRWIHPRVVQASIVHDVLPQFPQMRALIHLDPTFEETPREFHMGRLLPDFTPTASAPANVIGSFGFGDARKNFPSIVEQVNSEFDSATVRLHIPYNHYNDPTGEQARRVARACIERAKPGITVEVTHDFKTIPEMLEWLSGNSINCFFYEDIPGCWYSTSSVLDYALAAGRPIALTNSRMFRHVLKDCPSARIDGSSLRQIIAAGSAPLEPLRRAWNAQNFIHDFERIIDAIAAPNRIDLTSNRVLSANDREQLRPVVEELHQRCPGIMSRKIPQAVFQNAYIFEQVRLAVLKTDEIVVIGGYEDPAGPVLKDMGYNIRITDPQVDGKGAREVWEECLETGRRYDHVICCSVLEHVEEDENFIRYLYEILKPGGVAFLTADFKEGWKPGDAKPNIDQRLYTTKRMHYLADQLPQGALLDRPTWGPMTPYFNYENTDYCFCAFAFQKNAVCSPSEDRLKTLFMQLRHSQLGEIHRLAAELSNARMQLADVQSQLGATQLQLARFDPVQNAGPLTLKITGRMHRNLKRLPLLARVLKRIVRLCRPNARS